MILRGPPDLIPAMWVCLFLCVILLSIVREILPVVSSLRHNSYFEGVVEMGGRVAVEVLEELWYVLRSSQALRILVLSDCGLKP